MNLFGPQKEHHITRLQRFEGMLHNSQVSVEKGFVIRYMPVGILKYAYQENGQEHIMHETCYLTEFHIPNEVPNDCLSILPKSMLQPSAISMNPK